MLPDSLVLVTDGRYADRAERRAVAAASTPTSSSATHQPSSTSELVSRLRGIRPVGAEATSSHAGVDVARRRIGSCRRRRHRAAGRVKDAGEVARIATAGIADRALADVAPMLADRPTEADVRDEELDHRMRRLGAAGPSYDTIVASGPTTLPGRTTSAGRRTIVEGDTVDHRRRRLVDGYHSDMTRTFVVGDPTAEQRECTTWCSRRSWPASRRSAPGVAARVDAVSRTSSKPATSSGTSTAPATGSGC